MKLFSKLFKDNKFPVTEIDISQDSGIKHLEALTGRLDELEVASFNHFELLNLVVDTLDIAVWGKDKHGRFVFLNKVCADIILHSTVEAALNMVDKDFENDILAHVCARSDDAVMKSMTTRRFIEHAEYDTGPMWLDVTKSPWVRNGNLIGTVGSGRNITQMISRDLMNAYRAPNSIEIEDYVVLCDEVLSAILELNEAKNENILRI